MIFGVLRHRYVSRCEQIHKRRPNFDPRPISESGAAVLDDVFKNKPSDEMTAISKIEIQIAALQKQIRSASTKMDWGFVILLELIS